MDGKSPRSGRDTLLAFALIGLLGGIFFLFLNLVSFGIFFYVLAAVVGMTMLGFFHYVVWGYDLSQDVAEEAQRERQVQEKERDERIFEKDERFF